MQHLRVFTALVRFWKDRARIREFHDLSKGTQMLAINRRNERDNGRRIVRNALPAQRSDMSLLSQICWDLRVDESDSQAVLLVRADHAT